MLACLRQASESMVRELCDPFLFFQRAAFPEMTRSLHICLQAFQKKTASVRLSNSALNSSVASTYLRHIRCSTNPSPKGLFWSLLSVALALAPTGTFWLSPHLLGSLSSKRNKKSSVYPTPSSVERTPRTTSKYRHPQCWRNSQTEAGASARAAWVPENADAASSTLSSRRTAVLVPCAWTQRV